MEKDRLSYLWSQIIYQAWSFICTAVHSTILYSIEHWGLKEQHKKVQVEKWIVKMDVWPHKKGQGINYNIPRDTGMGSIEEKMTMNWLSWLEHMQRRPQEATKRRVDGWQGGARDQEVFSRKLSSHVE